MKRTIVVAVATALILTATAPAEADISGWIGRLSGEKLQISGTMAYGGAIGFSFAKYFGFEAVIDYIPNSELPFDLEELEEFFDVDVRVDLLVLSGNLLIQYPFENTVTPYFTVGYGGIGAWVSADTPDKPEAFGGTTAMNWGFGAKVFLAPHFSLRGDWRWYRLTIPEEELGDLSEEFANPVLDRMAIGICFSF